MPLYASPTAASDQAALAASATPRFTTIMRESAQGSSTLTAGTAQDLTVSLTLPTGLYWIGGVVQSAATTQPTVRVVSNWTPPVPISGGTSAPAATAAYVANTQTSVSGALPATFTATAVAGAAAVRVHVRAA
jgi:hypothetical protein